MTNLPAPDDRTPAIGSDGQTRTAFPSLAARTASLHTASTAPHRLPEAPPGYELIGELGRGGMGVVYQARQVRLNREVALKVILAGAHASVTQRQRFLREAEAAAALSHPGVVHVYEVGEHAGLPFMALELCPGGSLANRLADTPLPAEEAAALVGQLAHAVQAAHDRGVVHRDLKPANVLLTASGSPKVADFGLAKLSEDGLDMTASGAVFGTPSYAAPEQARGDTRNVGPPADVYALGAILYYCLTGRPPFKAATPAETFAQVLGQEPAGVRTLSPTVPVDLATVCHKCLEKEPAKRYPSAAALSDDLRRFLDGRPVLARPIGAAGRLWRWRKRNPGLAVAVGLAAVALVGGSAASIGFGLWAQHNADQARIAFGQAEQDAKAAIRNAELADKESRAAKENAEAEKAAVRRAERLVSLMSAGEGVRLADNGHMYEGLLHLAHPLVVAPANPNSVLMARAQFGTYLRFAPQYKLVQQFRHSDAVRSAAFSQDGGRVVTASADGSARVWDVRTGQPVTPPLVHSDEVAVAGFGTDGHRVITIDRRGIVRAWDGRTGESLIPRSRPPERMVTGRASPDGWQTVIIERGGFARVVETRTKRPLSHALTHADQVLAAALSPDGRRVVTAGADGLARVWEAGLGEGLATVVREAPRFAPVVRRSEERRPIVVRDASGRPIDLSSLLYQPPTESGWLDFSADGQWVAATDVLGTVGVYEVATGRLVSGHLAHARLVTAACFSPNGARLATVSTADAREWGPFADMPTPRFKDDNGPAADLRGRARGNVVRLWDARTGKPHSRSLLHPTAVLSVAFSPDSRFVVTGCSDNSARVWDADSGEPVGRPLVHEGSVQRAAFSADGRKLVTASADGTARVWDAETCRPVSPPIPHGGTVGWAAFSPDGERVVTVCADLTARVWDARSGRPRSPPFAHAGPLFAADFSPDGRRVATATSTHGARVWDAETGRPISPQLTSPSPIRRLAFSPTGDRLLTTHRDGDCRGWDISGDQRPVEDAIGLAQLLSARRIDATGAAVPLDADEVQGLWNRMRSTYPSDFAVERESALAWRRHAIDECVRAGELPAAEFHYWWLVAEAAQLKR